MHLEGMSIFGHIGLTVTFKYSESTERRSGLTHTSIQHKRIVPLYKHAQHPASHQQRSGVMPRRGMQLYRLDANKLSVIQEKDNQKKIF
jgi:hypothetical protein